MLKKTIVFVIDFGNDDASFTPRVQFEKNMNHSLDWLHYSRFLIRSRCHSTISFWGKECIQYRKKRLCQARVLKNGFSFHSVGEKVVPRIALRQVFASTRGCGALCSLSFSECFVFSCASKERQTATQPAQQQQQQQQQLKPEQQHPATPTPPFFFNFKLA
jgi:hypothetical protein